MQTPTITAVDGFRVDDIRDNLTTNGYAYVRALPNGFAHLAGLTRLGPLMAQYAGELVRDVKPDPAISNDVVSSANTAELTPHTEWYEFAGLPPRYVALWCVHPAEGGGGETTLADGYRLLEQYAPDEQERLSSNLYQWRSRPTLAREGVHERATHPIAEKADGTTVVRFSTLDLQADDDLSRGWVRLGNAFFTANKLAIKIERGCLLVWDNWRMMHARNAFTDPRRHLRRALIADHPAA